MNFDSRARQENGRALDRTGSLEVLLVLADKIAELEGRSGLEKVKGVASDTRRYLSTRSGLPLAAQFANHLAAYDATDDLIPFFGDHRLAHIEAHFQLQNSVCLAYHGFYNQAFSTLRSVCELSLLQASLPEGPVASERRLKLLRSMLPHEGDFPATDDVNWVLPAGFGASQTPKKEASSLEEWAVDGCRTPPWRKMRDRLLESDCARRFDSATQFSARLADSIGNLDPYVHTRGRLRSATGLSSGNMLTFSEDSLSQCCTRMMSTTQISITVLLLAFLPTATFHPDAAAGFIDARDFRRALSVLPSKDANLLRGIYDNLSSESGSV